MTVFAIAANYFGFREPTIDIGLSPGFVLKSVICLFFAIIILWLRNQYRESSAQDEDFDEENLEFMEEILDRLNDIEYTLKRVEEKLIQRIQDKRDEDSVVDLAPYVPQHSCLPDSGNQDSRKNLGLDQNRNDSGDGFGFYLMNRRRIARKRWRIAFLMICFLRMVFPQRLKLHVATVPSKAKKWTVKKIGRLSSEETGCKPSTAKPKFFGMYDQGAKVCVVTPEEWEKLESHVRRKLSHQLWGFPVRLKKHIGNHLCDTFPSVGRPPQEKPVKKFTKLNFKDVSDIHIRQALGTEMKQDERQYSMARNSSHQGTQFYNQSLPPKRVDNVAWMSPDTQLDLELNVIQKRMQHLQGMSTPYTRSLEKMSRRGLNHAAQEWPSTSQVI